MNTEKKAMELVGKFNDCLDVEALNYIDNTAHKADAKKCALIAVDEIISQWEYIDTYLSDLKGELNPNLRYWYEVKQKINQL